MNRSAFSCTLLVAFTFTMLPSCFMPKEATEKSASEKSAGDDGKSLKNNLPADKSKTFSENVVIASHEKRQSPSTADTSTVHEINGEFQKNVQPILKQYCYPCHNNDTSEADLNIEKLASQPPTAKNSETWSKIYDALQKGDMPPEDESQLSESKKKTALNWLQHVASHYAEKRGSLRRLAKYELNYTLQDLLGIKKNFVKVLPDDGESKTGFKNNSDALKVSRQYLEIMMEVIYFAIDEFRLKRQAEVSGYNEVQIEKFLADFLTKAFRTTKIDDALKKYLAFYQNQFKRSRSKTRKADAVFATCRAILCSPYFYYIGLKKQQKNFHLAEKMAYFLWASCPDKQLLNLASTGKLSDNKVLAQQLQRMTRHPKSKRMTKHFAMQWLQTENLYKIALDPNALDGALVKTKTNPRSKTKPTTKAKKPTQKKPTQKNAAQKKAENKKIKKARNALLRLQARSMRAALTREANEYVDYIFKNDISALAFIKSDFVIVNPILANLYRLKHTGPKEQFQKIDLPKGSVRGGLLTQSIFLISNSHVIFRGKWVIDRLLNSPPSPPPPGVPDLDEEKPSAKAKTLTQRLILHRSKAACASCHAKIDPWGFPLENFDRFGVYKTQRIVQQKRRGSIKKIENETVLSDGTKIKGIHELKNYIYNKKSYQFSEGLVTKLLTYSAGREMTFNDRRDIKMMTDRFVASGYRMKKLLNLIITSQQFQE